MDSSSSRESSMELYRSVLSCSSFSHCVRPSIWRPLLADSRCLRLLYFDFFLLFHGSSLQSSVSSSLLVSYPLQSHWRGTPTKPWWSRERESEYFPRKYICIFIKRIYTPLAFLDSFCTQRLYRMYRNSFEGWSWRFLVSISKLFTLSSFLRAPIWCCSSVG